MTQAPVKGEPIWVIGKDMKIAGVLKDVKAANDDHPTLYIVQVSPTAGIKDVFVMREDRVWWPGKNQQDQLDLPW